MNSTLPSDLKYFSKRNNDRTRKRYSFVTAMSFQMSYYYQNDLIQIYIRNLNANELRKELYVLDFYGFYDF